MRLKLLTLILILLLPINSFAQEKKYSISTPTSRIASEGFADIVEVLLPAVVNISTSQKIANKNSVAIEEMFSNVPPGSIFESFKDLLENQPKSREVTSLGSGFVVSKDGYIVTNNHVIDKADKITVNLHDSRSFDAKVIGVDKKTDLALLKIDANQDLSYVKMGDSSKSRIGEWVIAIGNPFGLGGSVSVGIISAHGRDISSGNFDNFIQTDAAINKGNSGGPLFNIKGEVIGIATAIFSPSGGNVGVGFATPTSLAKQVIEQLKEEGKVTRGWLGVSIQDVTKEMADTIGMNEPRGAFVADVVKDGPADKAGILPTDIITRFDGQKIIEMKDLPKVVASTRVGKKAEVQVIRQGKAKILKAKIQKLDEEKLKTAETYGSESLGGSKASETVLGMDLADLTKKVKEQNKIKSNTKGILVVDVQKGSEAKKKKIEKGDIILSANQIPVSSISDLKNVIKKLKKEDKENIFLFIKREKLIKSNNFIQQKSATFAVILTLS